MTNLIQPRLVARFSLVPRQREFYDLYNRSAANTVAISERLVVLLDAFPEGADAGMRDIKELEHEGDRLSREAISALFAGDPDPVSLVRWKDIHEQLEEAVDACENAADVLEAILVKNR